MSRQSRLRRSLAARIIGAIDDQLPRASSEQIGDSEAFNGQMGTPDEIGYGVVFLASCESSYMTGTELTIDRGKLSGEVRVANPP